jgi:hypothetical protein
MTILCAGNTVYTHPMAKVMISIADDLLARIDAQAQANRETRSGFLQRLAERELSAQGDDRRKQLEDLLGPPVNLGGEAAKLIRADRESR